ncbi:MAG: hypothetical protein IPG80_21100 [Anaerolineales bacterium]|uniref:NBR1-Ig-like domain-containing protein n=1 Tax=Candidatus Villigracilis vicinus TaxID=3140679 RepID=UPI003136779F|nr:hypothetical protein [Anaerolineales bacterium]MBK9779635.1 hypothetical protein [Anaerolineales bacterium]
MLKKSLILITFAALLAACMPSQQPADIQDQVNTAIAGTMQVQRQIDQSVEGTVAALELAKSEATPTNSDSAVALQAADTPTPTETPFVLPSPTAKFTVVPPKYACTIMNIKPRNNSTFSRGDAFDIKWRITNTGSATWVDGVDVKMISGPATTGAKRVEINKALKPGESYDLEIDANAPTEPGTYVMAWAADGPICYAYLSIVVK